MQKIAKIRFTCELLFRSFHSGRNLVLKASEVWGMTLSKKIKSIGAKKMTVFDNIICYLGHKKQKKKLLRQSWS